jgi:hypothetical protein
MGGFVANYRPAEFDQARNSVSPPSKHILFNRNLIHNDGLLYAHASEASGFGYKDVQTLAETYMEGIRRDIKRGMKFEIEGLGYFYLDNESQVQFTEESGNNFLMESYGLPFLQYRELDIPVTDSYRAPALESHPLSRQRNIRRWAYGAAAACLLAAMIIIPARNGYFNQARMDVSPDNTMELKNPSINNAGLSPSLTTTSASFLAEPEYNIVVGSFKDFGNAREFRSRVISKGYDARILCLDHGSYRVTAGTFSEQSEARVELAFVLSDFDDAWVLSN